MKKLIGAFVTVSLLVASIFFVSCSSDEDSLGGNSIPVNGQSKFNTYEKPIDVTTNATPTANTKYIYFGVFPKTVLTIGSPVTVDETKFIEMGANTYYKGSDGNYYAKVLEKAYRTGSEYKYSDGTLINKSSANSYRYFKVEPIKWKVLTTNYNNTKKALLLAENILTANVQYYVDTPDRRIDGSTISANNYKYSIIRAYLNGKYESSDTQEKTAYADKGFLQTAFTGIAQSIIAETEVDNLADSTTDAGNNIKKAQYTYCSSDTTDKIFLLSQREVTTSNYGFATYDSHGQENARIRETTDYAKANYSDGWWWLRSPNDSGSFRVRVVYSDGEASGQSEMIDFGYGGIVPALCISLK